MYYYITESPRSREEARSQETARTLLTAQGIAGEFATVSPARGAEELAEIGVAKKYTTVVAMGSDALINQVATLLAGTPYVFGAIPIENPASLELVTGIATIETAIEALKYRRVHLVPVARLEPNKFFVSELTISLDQPAPVRLTVNSATAELLMSHARIAGSGRVLLKTERKPPSGLGSFFKGILGTQEKVFDVSQFSGSRIVLETEQNLPVHLGRELFAKTPLAITVIPQSLKIITRRDRIAPL